MIAFKDVVVYIHGTHVLCSHLKLFTCISFIFRFVNEAKPNMAIHDIATLRESELATIHRDSVKHTELSTADPIANKPSLLRRCSRFLSTLLA